MPNLIKVKNSPAMTLVETMVALAIIALVSTGVVAAVSFAIRGAVLIQDKTIAINLAQEGLEVVRNIRDNAWYQGNNFASVLPVGTWQIQWDSQSLAADSDLPIKVSSSGIYQYTSGSATKFKRKIIITDMSASEKKIESKVSWNIRSGTKTVSAELRLFNWK